MADDIGPIPAGILAAVPADEQAATTEWLNNLLAVTQRTNTLDDEGRSFQMAAQADSTATTVAEVVTDLNALFAKLRASGKMEP